MALGQWWTIVIAAGAAIIAVAVGLLLARRKDTRAPALARARVARAERLRELPSFRRALRQRALWLAAVLLLGFAATLTAGLVAARPMASQTIQPTNTSRDIMLCLDVSGSMSEVDIEVLDVFESLLKDFKGERIGLTIFNSSPVQVFPLTDDYEFIRERINAVRLGFDFTEQVPEHWVGTLNGTGASLIGDGLAACATAFDHPDLERSRSIIFATDNEENGASIVTLEEASAYAKSFDVRVFALNPVQGKDADVSTRLSDAANMTGGAAYGLRDTTTVDDIVEQVQEQEGTILAGKAQVVWADKPDLWLVVLLVMMLAFVTMLWRARL